MIRPLRQRHRRMFAVLGVMLPVAFVVGITARKPVPATASLPLELSSNYGRYEVTRWSRADLFAKTPIHAALVCQQTDASRFAVELSATKDFAKPDLLVYWVAGNVSVTDAIPDNAVLLGSFNGTKPLPFPAGATSATGVLILYSLADHEVVEVSKPLTL